MFFELIVSNIISDCLGLIVWNEPDHEIVQCNTDPVEFNSQYILLGQLSHQ